MDIILVPGFWLDASAWDDVVPPLNAAGHSARGLTLPGLTLDADRSGIHLSDHVDTVVAAIDEVPEDRQVVLVGHSAGGGLVYAAAGQRPERVARCIYVDSGPMGEGQAIDADLDPAVVDHELPQWDGLQDGDLVDLDDELRAQFRARAIPQPGHTVREGHHHQGDPAVRRAIPATVIACEFPSEVLRQLVAEGHPYMRELAHVTDYEIVDLPTGHWPMFTKPRELAEAILAAVDRTGEASEAGDPTGAASGADDPTGDAGAAVGHA